MVFRLFLRLIYGAQTDVGQLKAQLKHEMMIHQARVSDWSIIIDQLRQNCSYLIIFTVIELILKRIT